MKSTTTLAAVRERRRRPRHSGAITRKTWSAPGPESPWPRVSVVVCAHNEERTIGECLEGLRRVAYPDYEIIVVDDGSTDATSEIASRYACRLIRTDNRGVSSARNTGLAAATGDIVAYIDADAYPDRQWLRFVADTLRRTSHAGVGGPNLSPPHDGWMSHCVDNAPGNPMPVLLGADVAEHIPGCNMAFRREALEAIGGFDSRFRVAGDDIDLCWRLRRAGRTLGYHRGALVWHHRRSTLAGYLRQQRGYGRAEALLARKWPGEFGVVGQMHGAGTLAERATSPDLSWRRTRAYHGLAGHQPLMSGGSVWSSLPLMPEWYLALGGLGALTLLGIGWSPLSVAALPLALGSGAAGVQAVRRAARAHYPSARGRSLRRAGLVSVTAALHVLQPIVRMASRVAAGLTLRRLAVGGWRLAVSGTGEPAYPPTAKEPLRKSRGGPFGRCSSRERPVGTPGTASLTRPPGPPPATCAEHP